MGNEILEVHGNTVSLRRGFGRIIIDPDADIPYGGVPEIIVNRIKATKSNKQMYYRVTGVISHDDKRYMVSTVTTVFGEEFGNGQLVLKKTTRNVKSIVGYQGDHCQRYILHKYNHEPLNQQRKGLLYKAVSRTAALLHNLTGEEKISIRREPFRYVNKDEVQFDPGMDFIISIPTPAIVSYANKHRLESNSKKLFFRTVLDMLRDKNNGDFKNRADNASRYAIQWVVSHSLMKNVDYSKYGTDSISRKSIIGTMSMVCCYCGGEADSADHVIPTSAGGPDMLGNIVPACRSCNEEKSCVSVFDYIGFKPGARVIATALGTVIDSKFSSVNSLKKAPVVAQIAASLF